MLCVLKTRLLAVLLFVAIGAAVLKLLYLDRTPLPRRRRMLAPFPALPRRLAFPPAGSQPEDRSTTSPSV